MKRPPVPGPKPRFKYEPRYVFTPGLGVPGVVRTRIDPSIAEAHKAAKARKRALWKKRKAQDNER